MLGPLVLVRHGQSDWNLKNLFTGLRDPDLTEKGCTEAISAGESLNALNIRFDMVFSSMLKRAQATCRHILDSIGQPHVEPFLSPALNERDYGELSGLNKDEARLKWGDAQVRLWRRSYEAAPPEGESLKDVGARVWLFYLQTILPHLLRHEKVLIVAHGNSLRSLVMALERLSPEQIMEVELPTAIPFVYHLNSDSTLASKNILQ